MDSVSKKRAQQNNLVSTIDVYYATIYNDKKGGAMLRTIYLRIRNRIREERIKWKQYLLFCGYCVV